MGGKRGKKTNFLRTTSRLVHRERDSSGEVGGVRRPTKEMTYVSQYKYQKVGLR